MEKWVFFCLLILVCAYIGSSYGVQNFGYQEERESIGYLWKAQDGFNTFLLRNYPELWLKNGQMKEFEEQGGELTKFSKWDDDELEKMLEDLNEIDADLNKVKPDLLDREDKINYLILKWELGIHQKTFKNAKTPKRRYPINYLDFWNLWQFGSQDLKNADEIIQYDYLLRKVETQTGELSQAIADVKKNASNFEISSLKKLLYQTENITYENSVFHHKTFFRVKIAEGLDPDEKIEGKTLDEWYKHEWKPLVTDIQNNIYSMRQHFKKGIQEREASKKDTPKPAGRFYLDCVEFHAGQDITSAEIAKIYEEIMDELQEIYKRDYDCRFQPMTKKTDFKNLQKDLARREYHISTTKTDDLAVDIWEAPIDIGDVYSPWNKTLFIDTTREKEISNDMRKAQLLHDLVPGLHTLHTYKPYAKVFPEYRRHLGATILGKVPYTKPNYAGFVEGWARYAEILGEEMGVFYDEKYEWCGWLKRQVLHKLSVLADIRYHYNRYTKKDVLNDLDHDYGLISREHFELVFEDIIINPGYALAGRLGEKAIRRLREDLKYQLGSKFSLRHFHDRLLSLRPMPLSVLSDPVVYGILSSAPSLSQGAPVIIMTLIAALWPYFSYKD